MTLHSYILEAVVQFRERVWSGFERRRLNGDRMIYEQGLLLESVRLFPFLVPDVYAESNPSLCIYYSRRKRKVARVGLCGSKAKLEVCNGNIKLWSNTKNCFVYVKYVGEYIIGTIA